MGTDNRSKLAALVADIPGVLREAASHSRKLAGKNVELEKRATDAEHELRLVKIARRMEERGIEATLSYDQKIAGLRGIPESKLAGFEHGIELASAGISIGAVGDAPKTAADSSIDDFIMSGAAYGG